MELDISSIRYTEGASFQTTISKNCPPFEWAGEEIRFDQPVTAKLELTNTGKLILAEGHIETVLVVACSRCLEPFNLALKVPFRMGYTEHQEQGAASPDEDLEVRLFSGDVIDVTPDVEETILLSLPMKSLCSQNCRGLCAQCGQNLNVQACDCEQDQIDPRLAVLRDFIKK